MDLRRSDAEAILGFLAAVDDLDDGEPYGHGVLDLLGTLIPCDEVGYQDANLVERRFISPLDAQGDEADAEDGSLYWTVGPCPLMDYRARTGDLTAARMTDVVSPEHFHESRFYREYFEPVGLDHVLDLGLGVDRQRYRSVVLLRSRDAANFSERDRIVLEALRPHLRAREARADLRRSLLEVSSPSHGTGDHHALASLTPREREVVYLASQGKTNAEIAADLWVTPSTVKKHLENVYAKLGVGRRVAAVTWLQAAN